MFGKTLKSGPSIYCLAQVLKDRHESSTMVLGNLTLEFGHIWLASAIGFHSLRFGRAHSARGLIKFGDCHAELSVGLLVVGIFSAPSKPISSPSTSSLLDFVKAQLGITSIRHGQRPCTTLVLRSSGWA
ncbi:hypothetical protein U1Q18_010201 [Sarracenia purpurea var. burkii]